MGDEMRMRAEVDRRLRNELEEINRRHNEVHDVGATRIRNGEPWKAAASMEEAFRLGVRRRKIQAVLSGELDYGSL